MPDDENGDMLSTAVSPGTIPAVVDLRDDVNSLRAERDALRQRVESLAADLDNLARIRDEFIATASHDLKSPLTPILSGAQYIERILAAPIPDAGKATKWARVIQDQARIMTLLINDLLDASRIQTGEFDLRPAPCDINACAVTAIKRLGPDAQPRITLTQALHPTLGWWDRQRIEQVLSNLLDNALKYSPNGEKIAVVVEERAEEVEVSVSDRGVGISPAELPRLFERFYRTPHATAGRVPGTGLGLYICDRIITAHGGRLWAESVGLGDGARLRFTLPMSPPTVATTATPEGQAR
ncbi:MAG: hypothetical protein NVS2B16_32190 [Chloroflexota bacterium]